MNDIPNYENSLAASDVDNLKAAVVLPQISSDRSAQQIPDDTLELLERGELGTV